LKKAKGFMSLKDQLKKKTHHLSNEYKGKLNVDFAFNTNNNVYSFNGSSYTTKALCSRI
jgi:hypothetical protein